MGLAGKARITAWCWLGCSLAMLATAEESRQLEVLPADQTVLADPVSGAKLTFLTTKTPSTNLYFHERSWLADSSMILFNGHRGLTGSLVQTGELVVLASPVEALTGATAAAQRSSFFCMRGNDVLEITPTIRYSPDPANIRSTVSVTERLIATLPASGQLNANYDDQYLSVGFLQNAVPTICVVEVATGRVQEICKIESPLLWKGHLQWSRTHSNLLSFAVGNDWHREDGPSRLWVVDPKIGVPRPVYLQVQDELVTHESWWGNDQILFCGAPAALKHSDDPQRREMSHVNILNLATGEVRILGAGAWWPGATDAEIWRRNWWHCAGSSDGRWVVADNPHGDLALFEGSTTRPRLLTTGHRTYGGGVHPHPGWDRQGLQVIFASHLLSNEAQVCVATIPGQWQQENSPTRKP